MTRDLKANGLIQSHESSGPVRFTQANQRPRATTTLCSARTSTRILRSPSFALRPRLLVSIGALMTIGIFMFSLTVSTKPLQNLYSKQWPPGFRLGQQG